MKDKQKYMQISAILALITFTMLYMLMHLYMTGEIAASDYPAHINEALTGVNYSIMAPLFLFWIGIFKSSYSIVYLMMMIHIATVIITAYSMKKILNIMDVHVEYWEIYPFSITMGFIAKIYIPYFYAFFYGTGNLVTQPWQNSTSLIMRMFSSVVLYYFFYIQKDYLKEINYKKLIIFTMLLSFINFAKPNFIMAFAPMMLTGLIYDFIKTKTKSFKNAFAFGVCVLISMIILIFQSYVLYPSDGTSGIVFSIDYGYTYLQIRNPLLNVFSNFSFPLFILFLSLANRKKIDTYNLRMIFQTWLMEGVAIFTYMFFRETGMRAGAYNFVWGPLVCSYLLFMISGCQLIKLKKYKLISQKIYHYALIIYIIHVFFGFIYIGIRLTNHNLPFTF